MGYAKDPCVQLPVRMKINKACIVNHRCEQKVPLLHDPCLWPTTQSGQPAEQVNGLQVVVWSEHRTMHSLGRCIVLDAEVCVTASASCPWHCST